MQNLTEGVNKNLLIICATIVLVCLIVAVAVLSSSKSANTNTGNNPPSPNPTSVVKVSVDDDPVLGDKNAPLTMIEFSDYECPFCKRHFDQVYSEIKRDYIDTGKVKLVYRDFIAVPGHNPLATSEAMAAECSREQGSDASKAGSAGLPVSGNEIYFKYHDEIFKRTISNGNGMAVSQLGVIAKDLGLNVATFKQCLDSNKFKDEVNKDITDARAAGVNGTPSFFVGKSTQSGVIDGTMIVGAQPFSAFKAVIDTQLAK